MTKHNHLISTCWCVWTMWAASFAAAANNEITEPFEGVQLIHTISNVPRMVDMWVVEIDPKAAGISFRASPSNGDLPGEVTPQTVRAFVTKIGAQLGVNASFFALVGKEGKGQFNVSGLSVSNGDAYSEFQSGFVDAMNVSKKNVAKIIRGSNTTGTKHRPASPLYNAVGGNTRLVKNGMNVAKTEPAIHPRTATGVTADGKLLLVTVDGREEGHSIGLTYSELADVLIRWGARDAINLDGGGSTTLVMDNPLTAAHDPEVKNIPCDKFPDGRPHGRERAVANSFAVFAKEPAKPTQNEFVYADFEKGDAGTFNSPLTFSGSNRGINRELSKATIVEGQAHDGVWSQRLTIVDDPKADGDKSNPGGAWFVRHVSGTGTPANNVSRPAVGSVGLWAKTANPNLRMSLVVDDASGATGERGIAKSIVADGKWHPYFWKLDDKSQWEAWVHGDGKVDKTFTLDSIQIFGPRVGGSNQDATIDIDAVTHIMPGYLPGDFNSDGVVDQADYVIWRKELGSKYTQGDYDVWRSHQGQRAEAAAGASATGCCN